MGSSPPQKPAALVTRPNVSVVYRRNEDDFGGRSSRWFMPGKTKTYPQPEVYAAKARLGFWFGLYYV